ncbi:hypothetical protein AGDE_14809 [Angomonas deanei]|uniref:Uncharacterized protein n=1 Tax=Angomonas deanei TaxID=59799 RepID=A0A7G2CK59_9TRYP|nr:hypothetical protein AGDE_14809 [Angomonas deanei]CAD2220258.1 hypothetical protein, conserved [Angomonas deanei]|eukprot:EPY20172.1 hypothetical protein AGDE_14809 [Angomonas deanei]
MNHARSRIPDSAPVSPQTAHRYEEPPSYHPRRPTQPPPPSDQGRYGAIASPPAKPPRPAARDYRDDYAASQPLPYSSTTPSPRQYSRPLYDAPPPRYEPRAAPPYRGAPSAPPQLPAEMFSPRAPQQGDDIVFYNPMDSRQAPVLSPDVINRVHRASVSPPSRVAMPYERAIMPVRPPQPVPVQEYYPVPQPQHRPEPQYRPEPQRRPEPQPRQIPRYVQQILEERERQASQSPPQTAQRIPPPPPQQQYHPPPQQRVIDQPRPAPQPQYYPPPQQQRAVNQPQMTPDRTEYRPNSRLQFRGPARAVLPEDSPYLNRPPSRDGNAKRGMHKVFPPGVLEKIISMQQNAVVGGYGHYLPAPPTMMTDLPQRPPVARMLNEGSFDVDEPENIKRRDTSPFVGEIPSQPPVALPVQPHHHHHHQEEVPEEAPHVENEELMARLQELRGLSGKQPAPAPPPPAAPEATYPTEEEGSEQKDSSSSSLSPSSEEEEQPASQEEAPQEEAVEDDDFASANRRQSPREEERPPVEEAPPVEERQPVEENKDEDPYRELGLEEGDDEPNPVEEPKEEAENEDSYHEIGSQDGEQPQEEEPKVDSVPQERATLAPQGTSEYHEIGSDTEVVDVDVDEPPVPPVDMTKYEPVNEIPIIYEAPYRVALQDAFMQYVTLESQFVRVNEETNEAMEDLVHVVQLNQTDKTGDRHYISKGLHQEILPLLKYPEGEEIPEFFLTYEGFANLCCGIWLSRFHSLPEVTKLVKELGLRDTTKINAIRGLPEKLDTVFAQCVQTVLEQAMKDDLVLLGDAGVSPEEIFANKCSQLIDWDNLECWPETWKSTQANSLADHSKLFISLCAAKEGDEVEVPTVELSPKEVEARKTWRLFLGASQWNVEDSLEEPKYMPSYAVPLAYSFVSRSRVYNISGGVGALFFSVITQQISEAAFFDSMLLLEKLRMCLTHCHESSAAQLRQDELRRVPFKDMEKKKSPVLAGDVWDTHFHRLEKDEKSSKKGAAEGPNLYNVVLHICSFFPNKDERSLRILFAALMEDLLQHHTIKMKKEMPEEERREAERVVVREGVEAMLTLSRQIRELESGAQIITAHNEIALLTEDEKVNFLLLRTHVDVRALFQYRHEKKKIQENADIYVNPALDLTAYGCKGAFVESVRAQYMEELLDYTLTMQNAIMGAVERDLTEEESRRVMAQRAKESGVSVEHMTNLFDEEELSISTVRSILLSIHEQDPNKPIRHVCEYLRHLLILYFEEHDVEDDWVDGDTPDDVRSAQRITAKLSLQDWFGENPITGERDKLCDNVCVHVDELAAYCSRVIGRYWGNQIAQGV